MDAGSWTAPDGMEIVVGLQIPWSTTEMSLFVNDDARSWGPFQWQDVCPRMFGVPLANNKALGLI